MITRTTTASVLVLVSALLLTACTTFHHDWNAMASAVPTDAPTGAAEAERAPADAGIEGRWQGTWLSAANGHNGGLKCLLMLDESGSLQARYHATYAGFLTFEYTVPLTVRREGDTYHFSGEADLGWLAGGHYVYEGTVLGDAFTSTYECPRDHGARSR